MPEMARPPEMPHYSVPQLEAAFSAFAPLKVGLVPNEVLQGYPAAKVVDAFVRLKAPLALAVREGGLLNLWSIAGLKRDEIRVAQALRGLWTLEFGGGASRRFLAHSLAACIGAVDWEAELAGGYRVATEIAPLGLRSERVDIAIETAKHIVGIEMKIDAGLGPRQLERYAEAIATRARWQHAAAHVVLLAPFASSFEGVPYLSWSMLAEAARSSVDASCDQRNFAEQLIASFGDYVKTF
jgi:hypothetical protein